MMNVKIWVSALAAALALTACGGGGGDPGTSPFGGNGTTTATASSAAALIVTLSKSSVSNTDTTPVVVTVTAVNPQGEVVTNAPISFTVSGGQLSRSSTVTGSDGKLTASIDFSSDKSNRVVTVTAVSGNLSESRSFSVTGVRISTTAVPTVLSPGDAGRVDVIVSDANPAPIPGIGISVSSPAGSSTGTTSLSTGSYSYNYTVPSNYTGTTFPITVTSGGVTQVQTVSVQQSGSSTTIPDAVGSIGTTTVSISPSVIIANETGSDANQVIVKFKVFDASSNPMKNVRVSFDENGVLPFKGRFSSGSSLLYTDDNGEATSNYIPRIATGSNELVLRACYSTTDFTPASNGLATSPGSACPAAKTQTGTIVKDAFNVTIGPNDKIEETSDGLRYVVKYVVQVVNAAGQAKPNVQITPTLDLLGYEKGYWSRSSGGTGPYVQTFTLAGSPTYNDPDIPTKSYPGCTNEDRNRNGVNDGTSEDVDGDTVLEPRKSDAAISFIDPAVTKTDSTGAVGLQVTYLKSVASWLRIKIYVTGAVSGTEGKGTHSEILAVPTTSLSATGTPAFALNPYGSGTSCISH